MRWISSDSRYSRSGFAASVAILFWVASASAHSPHDIITDLAVDAGGHAYIVITDQVFRLEGDNSSWKNLDTGLDIQHQFTSLALSPDYSSDGTVYVATSGDGIYRSTDAGSSWSRFNTGLPNTHVIKLFVRDADDASHELFAILEGGALWWRAEGAVRWTPALGNTAKLNVIASERTANSPSSMYAGDAAGGIWRSEDQGRLWEISARVEGSGGITSIDASGDVVFVGTVKAGLHVSYDRGETFSPIRALTPRRTHDCRGVELEHPILDSHVTSVTLSDAFDRDRTVYVTTWFNAVYVSKDGGESWSKWEGGLGCDRQADTEGLPYFTKLVVASVADGEPAFWLGSFNGLYRSSGYEAPWRQTETLPLGLIKGFALFDSENADPVIALATYGGGFYITEDLGASWTIGNRGLVTTRLSGVAFSKEFPKDRTLLAGADQRLLVSNDGGHSWQRIPLLDFSIADRIGLKLREWSAPAGVTRVFYRPGAKPRIYPTQIVTQHEPKQDQVLFATRFHGLMEYRRSSGEFESVWDGTDRIMNFLARSPALESDGILFASIRGEGLVKSSDAGATWKPVNSGLEFVDRWRMEPEGSDFRRDVQVEFSPDFGSDGTVFAGSAASSGLYVSKDRGESWLRTSLLTDEVSAPVLAISVSPDFRSDRTLLVSVRGHGLLRSTDGGETFERVADSLRRKNASIEYLAYARDGQDALLIAASDEELFVSRDNGGFWRIIDRPIRYEDMRDVVVFDADWARRSAEDVSAMTETVSDTVGASVSLDFIGTGVRWIGSSGPHGGAAELWIDGRLVQRVATRTDESMSERELAAVTDLQYGWHTLTLTVVPLSSEGNTGLVSVDAFDVLSNSHAADR